MGNCTSTVYDQHDRRQSQTMERKQNESESEDDYASSYSLHSVAHGEQIDNYRAYITRAYVHDIQQALKRRYANTEFELFVIVPNVINSIIQSYYLHYQVYAADVKQHVAHRLPELERLVYDTDKVFHGEDKLYVRDFANRMHAFLHDDANSKPSGNRHRDQQYPNNHHLLQETYCFTDFMHCNEIESIKHSLFNEHRKVIKLRNNNIYTQYSKKANGWNQVYHFKLKRLNVIEIDCGFHHSLFLTSNGNVFSQGRNEAGQCGIVRTKNRVRVNDSYIKSPTLIETFVQNGCRVVSISCGYAHNVCIAQQRGSPHRQVWMFGNNNVWQCNPNTNSDYVHDIYYSKEIYLPRRNDSFADTSILKAKCGTDFTVLLSEKGFLYGLGNINGVIHLDIQGVSLLRKSHDVVDFDVGSKFVVFVTDKQKIYSLESKQSWWYGWNRHRTFTQDWNGSKPVLWKHDMFDQGCRPSSVHKILIAKKSFILFMK